MKSEKLGERFLPNTMKDNQIKIEHLQRYHALTNLIKGKIVLDAACGEGYGSFFMSKFAANVIGIDIAEDVIKEARKKYNHTNLVFFTDDIIKMNNIKSESIDVLVSFETIEHIEKDKQVLFLNQVKRVLSPSGLLIMSTPEKKIYSDALNYKNEFHLDEFYLDEYKEFLGRFFLYTKYYYQIHDIFTMLIDDEGKVINLNNLCKTNIKEHSKFIISISSGISISDELISQYSYDNKKTYIDFQKELVGFINNIRLKENYIRELEVGMREKDAYIKELEVRIKDEDTYIKELEVKMKDEDTYIKELEVKMKDEDTYIKELEVRIKDKDAYIKELEVGIREKDVYIKELEVGIREKEDYINEIENNLSKKTQS